MKKYLLLILILSVFTVGCGQKPVSDKNSKPHNIVEFIAQKTAVASLNNDKEKEKSLLKAMIKRGAKTKKITKIDDNCAEITYIYKDKEQTKKYCKK